jgi:superfamily II DNA or RNA helicase
MPLNFRRDGQNHTMALLRENNEFGLPTYDLVNPPRRFWSEKPGATAIVEQGIDAGRVKPASSPVDLLAALHTEENPAAHSRRSIARLFAFFLMSEDPQRKLDARKVETLAHQVSLIQHILEHDRLKKVLIADEVGLGKTVEVGLLVAELVKQQPGLQVLYLAPARLVPNVRREFDKMELNFRQWTAFDGDARLTDSKILASLHRAVHGRNFEEVMNTGPWDVIIVDECHHLSAWNEGGTDPRESYRLVRGLIQKQRPGGRVILLSGTPHQGNITRFENLLLLLQENGEPEESLGGRVIYRTKEDIRDWNNNRLFPARQVADPTVIDLGPDYRSWVRSIHSYYKPPPGDEAQLNSRQRAAGWRCAQALQWAVSSPQAGLGYLVRQAVRGGWKPGNPVFDQALLSLRPYRLGPVDEPVNSLFDRICREVRDSIDLAMEDIEFDEVSGSLPVHDKGLEDLLRQGIEIIKKAGNEKWQIIKDRLIDKADTEKVVLFAQPIETVIAISQFLEKVTGRKPALIVGGQSDSERQKQVESFWRKDGPQFLISSKAGGEGINLQVARRLIHIDVPWNPMDMEQRVGRVHRFGSTETILVDTVVVKESREAEAYSIARQKLHVITSTMVEPERFESIFSRVMCLVPPEDLQNVMIHGAQAPLSSEDQQRLADMVQQGFRDWNDFHSRYGRHQQEIRQQDPGLAIWNDVAAFLENYGKASIITNTDPHAPLPIQGAGGAPYSVLTLDDGANYLCGDSGTEFLTGNDGKPLPKIGLNLPAVTRVIRQQAFPELESGAAALRWNSGFELPVGIEAASFIFMAFLRQTVKTDHQSGWVEKATSLHCFVIEPEKPPMELEGVMKAKCLRGVLNASVRNKVDDCRITFPNLLEVQAKLFQQLRFPSQQEIQSGIRHAITPLFVGHVIR